MAVIPSVSATPPKIIGKESTEAGRVSMRSAAESKGASLTDPGVFSNVAVAIEQKDVTGQNHVPGNEREKLLETASDRQEELGVLGGARQSNAQAHAATQDDGVQGKQKQSYQKSHNDRQDGRSKGLLIEPEPRKTRRPVRAASTGDLVALKQQELRDQNKALRRTKSEADISALDVADHVVETADKVANLAKGTATWAGLGGTIGTLVAPGIGTVVGTAVGAIARLTLEGAKELWKKWATPSKPDALHATKPVPVDEIAQTNNANETPKVASAA